MLPNRSIILRWKFIGYFLRRIGVIHLMAKIKQWIQTHPWDTALMAALGVFGLWTGLWASVIILDDAMITFRVAENLAYGRGFVYNLGERIQVTTTPLYALVLAAGVWIFGDAPRAALVLNIALAVAIPVLVYDLGRRLAGRITGVGGAVLLSLSPLLVIAFSMESYLYVALILASMDAYAAGRVRLAGVLVGVTALVRGDAVLLGACMLTFDFLAHRRLRWQLIAPAIALPAGWYLFALLYYGSPFPATLGAKTAQGEFNWLGLRFLDGLKDYWAHWTEDPEYEIFSLFPTLLIIGGLWALWAERPWLIMIGRDLLYVTAFVALAVPSAEWYYAPLMPGVCLLIGRGAQVIGDGLAWIVPRRGKVFVSTGVAAVIVGMLLVVMVPITRDIVHKNPDWKALAYPSTARWIAENTNASANLSTIDIGHLGYWSGRRIIDIVGLAQPDVAGHIADGDFGYAIRHYQPDMVLLGYLWLPEIQSKPWFREAYVPRQYFRATGMAQPLVLWSRREGVKVQADTIPADEIQPLKLDFNRQITLTGYYLRQPLTPGGDLELTLFWQVDAPIEVDFTVFVQLVDTESQIRAQRDGKPQNGHYATTYWQPGERVIDVHTLPLPADLPPGGYDLLVGLYEIETGLRLQILDEAGAFETDHLQLSGIEVQARGQ